MERLASELIQEVTEQLPGQDIKNVRLVSKQLNDAAERVLWNTRSAVLHLNRDTLSEGMSMLEDWCNNYPASTRIRRLMIVSLAPQKELKPPSRYSTFTSERELKTVPPEPEDTEEVKEALRRLPAILPKALCALKGLTSVRWEIYMKDEPWTRDAVIESLATLPILAEFDVETRLYDPIPALSFDKFRQGALKRLSVVGFFSDTGHRTLTSDLATLFQYNPGLTELRLDNSRHSNPSRDFTLLFDDVPSGTVNLKSLCLNGWVIESLPKVLPHLRSLETFRFLDYQGEGRSLLWKSFEAEGIMLRRLTVESISSGFIEYLESFIGLEELSLLYPDSEREDLDVLAKQFYEKALPQHAASLRKLSICPSFDSGWAIGASDVHAFDGCTRLESLSVGLKSGDIQPERVDDDVVNRLITSLYQLPSITVVSIDPTVPQSFRNARCGTGRMNYRTRMALKTQEALGDVQFPIPVTSRQFCVYTGARQYPLSVIGDGSSTLGFQVSEGSRSESD